MGSRVVAPTGLDRLPPAGARPTLTDSLADTRRAAIVVVSVPPMSATVLVAKVGEVRPGQTKKFILPCGARAVEALVVNFDGMLYAYVNRCRHVPMSMDWIENRFLTEDGRFIQCATHGACYEPDTGLCVEGPALGRSLIRVPLSIHGDEVHATCPDEEMPVDLSRPKLKSI